MRNLGAGLIAGALVFGTGCTSSRHFPDQAQDAVHEIQVAEDAGALTRARSQLASARESLDFAQRAEEEATADRKDAHLRLGEARRRQQRAAQRLEGLKQRLSEETERRTGLEKKLEELAGRRDELQKSGVSDVELDRLLAPEVALAKVRLRESESSIGSLKSEIELADLEHKDGALALDAAQARLETAEKRLALAHVLYRRAEEQAKLAHAEADAARERELRAGVVEMGS